MSGLDCGRTGNYASEEKSRADIEFSSASHAHACRCPCNANPLHARTRTHSSVRKHSLSRASKSTHTLPHTTHDTHTHTHTHTWIAYTHKRRTHNTRGCTPTIEISMPSVAMFGSSRIIPALESNIFFSRRFPPLEDLDSCCCGGVKVHKKRKSKHAHTHTRMHTYTYTQMEKQRECAQAHAVVAWAGKEIKSTHNNTCRRRARNKLVLPTFPWPTNISFMR
jgi:hypothetical protein